LRIIKKERKKFMDLPNSDILVKNVDIPLLRKQYEWLLLNNEVLTEELEGLINFIEHILDQVEIYPTRKNKA
jgi:hypothetical protein